MFWHDFSSGSDGTLGNCLQGRLKTEVDANTLIMWLNYLAFTVVLRTYMFMVLLGCGQFLI